MVEKLTELELGKFYKDKTNHQDFHILTYIHTKTFGFTLLVEWYDGSTVRIVPIDKEDFERNIDHFEEIEEKDFGI
jgi:hypothetical protein